MREGMRGEGRRIIPHVLQCVSMWKCVSWWLLAWSARTVRQSAWAQWQQSTLIQGKLEQIGLEAYLSRT